MSLKNKLISLLLCSTWLLGWIQAQDQAQQQEQGVVKYNRDSLQRRYADHGYHDSKKKSKKWVQYEKDDDEDYEDEDREDEDREDEDEYYEDEYYEDENEDEDYDDDGYDDEQDEDCGDNEDEDFDWNPQGGKHVKPLPIPYVTFIGAKIPKTTATTTSTQENINESLTDHVIYITTVDIELLEGEIVGGSTVEFSPYGIRGGSGGLMPWQAPPEYPSEPICYADTAAEDQIKYLNHFTGIFGSFILETGNLVSIQGPVAARAMQATNISINILTDDEEYCRQADDIARYGLIVDTLSYNGHVNGSVAFSSVDVLQLAQTPQDCEVFVGASNEISARVLGLFPDVFIQTSASLASYNATYQFNADNSVSSIWTADAYSKYMIFTFPPCSDQTCEASPTDTDSLSNAILKGGSSWTGPSDPYFYYENKPTLLNIPVYVGQNYTITSESVNAGGGILDACHTIFHFYPVDANANIVTDPTATFNLIRGENVVVNGLILAPQANIYDAPTGGFGGQVVTMHTFYSQGATINHYSSVGTCRQDRFACWPPTNDMIVDFPYMILNALYHEDDVELSIETLDEETLTVVLRTQSVIDYTTVETTSHSTVTWTQTATLNATTTEAVLSTDIAQVIYLVNVTEYAIEHTTATATFNYTRTVAHPDAEPATSTLVLVATALVESVVTKTSTTTGEYVPPPSHTLSSEEYTQITTSPFEHNEEDCTFTEHHHYKHPKNHKKHRYNKEDEDDDDEDDDEDYKDYNHHH